MALLIGGSVTIAVSGKGRLLWVAMLVTCSIFAPAVINDIWVRPPAPLDTIVLQARSVTAVLLIGLLLPAVLPYRQETYPVFVPLIAIGFITFQTLYCFRYMVSGFVPEAFTRLVTFWGVFIVMGVGLPTWLSQQRRPDSMILYLVGGLSLVLLCCLYGLGVNPNSLDHNGRFHGVTGNANHMGINLAGFVPMVLAYLALGKRSLLIKLAVMGIMLFSITLLIWTGSRSGVWAAFIMSLVFYRRRLKTLFVTGGVAGLLFAYFFYDFVVGSGASEQGDRLISTTNTRAGEWSYAMQSFYESPVFGNAGSPPFAVVPGSYVTLLSVMGIFGVVAIAPFALACLRTVYLLWRIPKSQGEVAVFADMAIAAILGFSIHAIFEGTLFSTMSYVIFMIYIYVSFAEIALRQRGQLQPAAAIPGTQMPLSSMPIRA
ncbi:MAG: hypothetical protein AAGH92_06715 [Planctomycetota bacterium]